jgi:IS30 family transposase
MAARPNEDANGLLRQYFAKGTNLSRWDDDDVEAVAAEINSRAPQLPRLKDARRGLR